MLGMVVMRATDELRGKCNARDRIVTCLAASGGFVGGAAHAACLSSCAGKVI